MELTTLPTRRSPVTRADLIRYCGASGDFNTIHWSERIAEQRRPARRDRARHVHHGAGRARGHHLGRRAGRRGRVRRAVHPPVPVPDTDEGTEVVVTGVVKEVTDVRPHQARLTATCNGEKVLSLAARRSVKW
jgi:acyl dehydratase